MAAAKATTATRTSRLRTDPPPSRFAQVGPNSYPKPTTSRPTIEWDGLSRKDLGGEGGQLNDEGRESGDVHGTPFRKRCAIGLDCCGESYRLGHSVVKLTESCYLAVTEPL